MNRENIKLALTNQGINIIGEVTEQTKTTITFKKPAIVVFEKEGLKLAVLVEPSLTEENTFKFNKKDLLIQSTVSVKESVKDYYCENLDYLFG